MAKAAVTLLVLLSYLCSKVQADAHILSCNFTVKTRSIRTESTPQCSVDGVPLRPDDSDNTRKEGNAPKECADLFPKLKDIEEELRNQIHTIEEKGYLTTGDHTLLVTPVSLHKEGQPINAYWNFTLDEQYFFIFDLKNKKWEGIHNNIPGIDIWQNNTKLAQDLETFSIGDSDRCFKILSQLKKMTRPTSRAPDIRNVTSSPSQLPSTMNATQIPSTMNTTQLPSTMNATQFMSTKQPLSKRGYTVTIVLIVSFFIVLPVIFCIYKCVNRNSPQGGEMCCIYGNHGGQHIPSAVGESHPEESTFMIVIPPLEGDSPHGSSASSS